MSLKEKIDFYRNIPKVFCIFYVETVQIYCDRDLFYLQTVAMFRIINNMQLLA